MTSKNYLLIALATCLIAACSSHKQNRKRAEVDSINTRAYVLRYADIDSVEQLAQKAFTLSPAYPDGRNEARCNLAFARYQQMDFDGVDSILQRVRDDSSTPLLLLCADVLEMKTSQRTGNGEQFFRAKSQAEGRIEEIAKKESALTPHEVALWVYAQSEYHIITSTYYFYQEQNDEAREELDEVLPCLRQHVDTAQWVNYNYMLGPGGLVEGRDVDDITLQEFDYLFRAYNTSRRNGLRYFEANSLQALATMYLHNESLIREYRSDEYHLLRFQHEVSEGDSLSLPMAFAQHALQLFKDYDDLFQTACAYRTLGEVHFEQGNYDAALKSYEQALHCVNVHHLRYYGSISRDTLSAFDPNDVGRSIEKEWTEDSRISTVPDWISGIRQQLSLVYSAMDMKQASDYNRNCYLDLLLATNQDLELESRTAELERQTRALRFRMVICAVLLILTLPLAFLLFRRQKRSLEISDTGKKESLFVRWLNGQWSVFANQQEELREQLTVSERQIIAEKRINVENRSKMSLVHGIVPFLDRIGGEVSRMKRSGTVSDERREYIVELVDQIEQYNAVLTDWIKMEQGQLGLHISTFSLDRLFSIVAEGHYAFDQKGVQLVVNPTTARVKADEGLTMFMINTLCDNARKFTPEGGRVTLSASEGEDYVEVSVEDTGRGLSPEDVDTLTNNKVYDASEIGKGGEGKGFGFGLMNCRGIIEKYKKTSSLFASCAFGVRSVMGKGSTFFFRVPRVGKLLALLMLVSVRSIAADVTQYYDSIYNTNIEGRYQEALQYAQRCVDILNEQHPDVPPIMLFDNDPEHREASEILWARDGVDADYELIVGLRNEIALSALALHDLDLYRYNSRACIRLHRFIHQDRELPTYFRRLSQTHHNSNILLLAIVIALCLLLLFSIRLILNVRSRLQRTIELLCDEQAKLQFERNRLHVQNQILDNCLSTIKHESMYYPSRIRFLAERMQDADISQLAELVQYYRHIYTLLCQQADEQVSSPGFKRQNVNVAAVCERAFTRAKRMAHRVEGAEEPKFVNNCQPDTCVKADEMLLDQMLEALFSEMLVEGANITFSVSRNEGFVRFTLRDSATSLDEETTANLFFPESRHIPYLVAKQILREHDTYCNHPGCRLVAQPSESGYEIYFTLLLSKNSN